jgi:phosphoglycolate phosphatase-like HAD superfamily hydrolase
MREDCGLIIFDLDNTLVDVSSVHREGYHVALRRVFGLDGATFRKTYKGNPQPVTLRSMCEEQGVSPDVIEARLPDAVTVLSEVTVSQLEENLVPARLPGVEALLEALKREGCVLGLVTGTVSGTGRAILQRAGLDRYFDITVFGDEGMTRPELMALALERAESAFAVDQGPIRPVVVGDSPRDIRAGRAVEGWVIAVATGAHTAELLADYDPDHVLKDFSDTEEALKAILA